MSNRNTAQIVEDTVTLFGFRRLPEYQKFVINGVEGFWVVFENKAGVELMMSMSSDTSWNVMLQLEKFPSRKGGPFFLRDIAEPVWFSNKSVHSKDGTEFIEKAVMDFLSKVV